MNDGEDNSVADETTVTVGTSVGGIILVDTIWNTENSPYIITSNIQSAYAITLQVDSGVRIIGNDMDIEVFGSHCGMGANASVLLTVANTLNTNITGKKPKGLTTKIESLFFPKFWEQKGTSKFANLFFN